MAANSNEAKRLIDKFCAYIDELINIWENAEDRYIENKNFAGIPANFLAIKLGIATLNSELPYQPEDWDYASLEVHKRIDKGRTQRLRGWKRKARKEGKLKTRWFKTKVDTKKAQKLCDCLDETSYMLKANVGGLCTVDRTLHAKGLQVNDLGLRLGLIDQQWFIAMEVGLPLYDNPHTCNRWKWKNLAIELVIPIEGSKPPYIVNSKYFIEDNWTDIQTLQKFKLKVEALLRKKDTLSKRSQEKAARDGLIAHILKARPRITIAELADELKVSKPTVSRSQVWRSHRKKPPKDQFTDIIPSEKK